MSRAFDSWEMLPLAPPGRSLIEASAGTGKTWTIAALYLRLLLEGEGVTPRRIVVATFTNAAAAELRERLRKRIQRAERAAHGEAATDPDALDQWLESRWLKDGKREQDLLRLRIALAELDLAPIGTLHGLCTRILREHPFAAGGRFEPAELVDGDTLMRELATDLQRTLWQGDAATREASWPAQELAVLDGKWPGAKDLKEWLKPGLRVEPGETPVLPGPDMAAVLRGATSAIKGNYKNLIAGWNETADFIDGTSAEPPDAEKLAAMRNTNFDQAVSNAGKSNPCIAEASEASPGLADALTVRHHHLHLNLLRRLRSWGLERKQAWMQRHDSIGFDDLLAIVHDALVAEAGNGDARPLADALFAAWPVALIDEFQDTDDLQYGTLDAIYRDDAGQPRGRLLMIGDPKQAIYRFRGGDIHTYTRAAGDASEQLSLTVNQRSSTPYVDAVNAFFAAAGKELDAQDEPSSGIEYLPVTAAGRADKHPYAIDGVRVERPLVIHTRDGASGDKGTQVDEALNACASQIAAMLASGTHFIGEKFLRPEHIAVLLPDNHQVARLRTLLERKGVPCVTRGRDSVFAGDIARDLPVLMHAEWHAESASLAHAALLTRLGGMTLTEVATLEHDPAGAQRISLRFHDWRQRWRRRGVPALVDALIAERGPALLSEEDGERVLTDLRHLGELLQAQAETGMGEGELLAWFAAQRDGSGGDSEDDREARQLRIESQSPRVRLMTLHASKGLEFPVVFLPLMSMHEARPQKPKVVSLHDPAGGHRLQVDEAAIERDAREAQDERFRVLYVALTRAVHACHVFAVPGPDEDASGGRKQKAGAARSPIDILIKRMGVKRTDTLPHIEWREGWLNDTSAHYRHEQADDTDREARAMPPPLVGPMPSRHSFSSLNRGHHAGDAGAEAAADDEAASPIDAIAGEGGDIEQPAPEDEHPALLALAKPRGTGIGNALHDALEQRRIGRPMIEQLPLLASMLRRRNLLPEGETGTRLCESWATRLDEAFALPLGADLPPLAALTADEQRAEMEFHFALGSTSLRRLREACAAHGEPTLVPDSERRIAGLMTGKIDLLFQHAGRFHVLDYKGNFAGTRLSDYAPAALAQVMEANQYRFQALLYVVALDRHLRLRLPGYDRTKHLGDVSYLFLRAYGLSPGIGLWRHRFDDVLVEAVGHALPADTTEHAA